MGSIPHYFFVLFLLVCFYRFGFISIGIEVCVRAFSLLSCLLAAPFADLSCNSIEVEQPPLLTTYYSFFSRLVALHLCCCECNMYRFIVVRCVYVHTNQFKLNALTYSQVKMYRCFTKKQQHTNTHTMNPYCCWRFVQSFGFAVNSVLFLPLCVPLPECKL